MELAIIENEVREVDVSLEMVNSLFFDDSLVFHYFTSSQKFGDIESAHQYDLIFIDLDLSIKSKLDGYGLIKLFAELTPVPNMAIITAAEIEDVQTKLREKGLPAIDIIKKGIDIYKTRDIIKKYYE